MSFINVTELPNIDSNDLDSEAFLMVRRPFNDTSNLSFKVSLKHLDGYFLAAQDLEDMRKSIEKFRENIETAFSGFEQEEYLEDNGYMLKSEADTKREEVLRKSYLESMIEKYLKPEQLSADVKEAEDYAYSLINSYVAAMTIPAATVKSSSDETSLFSEVAEQMLSTENKTDKD